MKPSEHLTTTLRAHGAGRLADDYQECEEGPVQMEMHEWRDDLKMAVVSTHNIHADMIEDFKSADIPGLAFKIIP